MEASAVGVADAEVGTPGRSSGAVPEDVNQLVGVAFDDGGFGVVSRACTSS